MIFAFKKYHSGKKKKKERKKKKNLPSLLLQTITGLAERSERDSMTR